jgi:hypothetical protein
MGVAHFTLRQAQEVLERERANIVEEWHCLMEWGSLLKEWTTPGVGSSTEKTKGAAGGSGYRSAESLGLSRPDQDRTGAPRLQATPLWGTSTKVSTVLPLLDSAGAKMLKLEEVIYDQLEAEGHVLAEKVAEHVLMCFQS